MIYMQALLGVRDDRDRLVGLRLVRWAAGAGRGSLSRRYEMLIEDPNVKMFQGLLAVPVEQVKKNFERYSLLDDKSPVRGGVVLRDATQRTDRANRCPEARW